MHQFSATIWRDPTGYEWKEHHGFPTFQDDPENNVALRPQTGLHNVRRFTAKDFVYDPFVDEPALFRNFAKLDGSQDAIRDFAIKYGDLGGRYGGPYEAVTLGVWRMQIVQMRKLIERRDALVEELKGTLPTRRWIAKAAAFTSKVLAGVSVSLAAMPEESGVAVKTVCTNLYEAMKVQLATSLDRRTNYRECDFCSKSFEVTPSVNRSDRTFCSDNCRVKAYQRRKKDAIQLRQEGKSLREIVKAAKADMDSVQKWVADVAAKEKHNAPKKTRKR